jgi:uncharacterized protein (DUF2147 family)
MAFVVSAVKLVAAHLVTGGTDVYTCPASTLARISHAQVANVDGTADADVSISVYDASTEATVYLAKTITVPADASIKALGDCVGVWLEAGDKINAVGSADGDLDLVMAVMEYGTP